MARSHGMRWGLVVAVGLCTATAGHAESPSPLDDARLGASAPALRAVVVKATRDGLPEELLSDKVREGLAKHVAPPLVLKAVSELADALGRARREAMPYVGNAPPPALLKALAEAYRAGIQPTDLDAALRSKARLRAITVLTDLVQRGYPRSETARLVGDVSARDASALDRLPAQAERLRAESGLGPRDAIDALGHGGVGVERPALTAPHGNGDPGNGPLRDSSGTRNPHGMQGQHGMRGAN